MRKLLWVSLIFAVIGVVARGDFNSFPIVTWKPPVASQAALPATGNNPGDARIDMSSFEVWIWNGSTWNGIAGGSLATSGPTGAVQTNNGSGNLGGSANFTFLNGAANITGTLSVIGNETVTGALTVVGPVSATFVTVAGNITATGTITAAGAIVAGGTVTAPTFIGALTGHASGDLLAANNLSDVANQPAALVNILGTNVTVPGILKVNTFLTVAGNITATGTITAGGFVQANGATFAGNVSLSSNNIINLLDPTTAQMAATKNYVDTQLAQLNPLQAVVSATTATLTGGYTNAVSGVCIGDIFTETGNGALSIDGTSPTAGQRVLLKNQTSSFQDGVWTVTNAGSGITPYVLTRALDFDSAADINAGGIIPVVNGTANAGSSWYQSGTVSTCSSDPQTWTQFQKASSAYLQAANNLSDVTTRNTSFDNVAPVSPVKGDVIVYSGSHWVRLPVGSNTQVLTSDSTLSNGAGWELVSTNNIPIVQVKSTNYTAASSDNILIATAAITFTIPDCTGLSVSHAWQVVNAISTGGIVTISASGSTKFFDGLVVAGVTYQLTDPGANVSLDCNTGSIIYVTQ